MRPVDEAKPINPRRRTASTEFTGSLARTAVARRLDSTSGQSSIGRWFNFWNDYRSEGVAGVDARLHPKSKKRLMIAKADPPLVAIIDRELDSRVNMSTSSRRHCAELVRRALQAMYPGDPICEIKGTTLQGYINERDAGSRASPTTG